MGADLIQIVDENDRPTGSATKDETYAKGLWHRIARIVVEDNSGRVLLQLRGPNVKTSPNKWDHAAAGHVDFGESYDIAAARELAEETGITNVELQELGSYNYKRVDGARKINRFNKVYKVVVSSDVQLKPQASEVAELRWFTIPDAKKLVAEHPDKVTDGLQYAIAHFYQKV